MEDEYTVSKMFKFFKTHNSNWEKTQTVITDKDLTERAVLKEEEFPNAALQICMFHVEQSFRREVSMEKMRITSFERNNILNKCVHSFSEEKYLDNYQLLKSTKLNNVIEYFDQNWHLNRQEWVAGIVLNNLTLLNTTNNRIERLNRDIKTVCMRNASLVDFFKDFLTYLTTHFVERDHVNVRNFQTTDTRLKL